VDEEKALRTGAYLMIDRFRRVLKTAKHNFLFILGKVTWHEYFALYVRFHKMNETEIKESDTFDFVQGPFDNNCKYLNSRKKIKFE
jgi:hypothetical protein